MKKKIDDPYAAREASKYDNPIPSREYIAEFLANLSGPIDIETLGSQLGLKGDQIHVALRRRLRAMERDGQLISNRRGEFGLTGKMDLVRGRVQGHRDGFGFLIPTDGSGKDIYLTHRQMQKVFDGDEVLVSPGREDYKGRLEGKIVEVLSHNTWQLVGRLVKQGSVNFVRPDNPRCNHDIIVSAESCGNAEPGQFVVVEIVEQPGRHKKPEGKIIEVLGDHMAPGMEIDVAIRSYGIPHTWPNEVLEQAKVFTEEVKEEDKRDRIDLRNLPFVTIDGEDARDFDDAVFCQKKRGGGWRLYVAIADVSHYVKPHSPLDREALVRGNSVYFPDHVVPMLPHVLSNGLCSLNPHVDRLCMVCEMTVSAVGNISGYKFYEAVMHSHARLTYTLVGHMLDEQDGLREKTRDEYKAIVPHVDELYALFQVLRQRREERGAIDFETNETRIIFDHERKIEKIVPVERNDAHKLIEECMLAANVCAAKLLESAEVPTLYRVHEPPGEEKLEMLLEFLAGVGLSMQVKGEVTPQLYRDVLTELGDRPEAHLVQTVLLRSMSQARYQPDNFGHFGLAYSAYAHFTSPIRRYPDLLVHRAIRALVQSGRIEKKTRRVENAQVKEFSQLYPYDGADFLNFGEQCSTTERRADDATRDVIGWLKCEFLKDRVGESFDGVVSSVTSFGLFVELTGIYVEGLVHITSLPRDYYHHEAAHHRLVGERTRQVFRIGDTLRVQVVRVDLDERKIDFELVSVKARRQAKKETVAALEKSARKIRKRPVASASEGAESKKKNPKNPKSKPAKKVKKKTAASKKSKRGKSKKK